MSTVRRTGSWLVVLSTLITACSSKSDYGDAPDGATSQVAYSRGLGLPEPEVVVLVLDDRESALDLRQVAALQLESYAARALSDVPACSRPDPAHKKPLDRALVVVHPSASGDARFVSPADDPNLRWHEGDASLGGRTTWVTAMNAAVAVAHEEGPFAALEGMQSAVELVSGARAAQTPAESALVASLPKTSTPRVLLLAEHEDESPGEPSDYVVPHPVAAGFDGLLFPRATPSDTPVTCGAADTAATPRFAAWEKAQSAPTSLRWPCDGLNLLRQPLTIDCVDSCVNWRPTQESDGRATCLLTVEAAVDHCDPAFGWLDPLADDGVRRPVQTNSASGVVSTCEIQQLTGAALESCRSTLACSGCEPGWCATEVPELLEACVGKVPVPLRFTGGSDLVASGNFTLLCNVERVSSY